MTQTDVQNFINKYMNKYLDTDGYPSYNKFQCVDLIRQYQVEMIKMPLVGGNAINYWYDYPYNSTLQKYFTRIPNTLTFVPKLGDIGIQAATAANPYGHIFLNTNAGNIFYYTAFEQNDPLKSPCHYKSYNYVFPKFLGVLRPKSLS
jgi:hypothetical protein